MITSRELRYKLKDKPVVLKIKVPTWWVTDDMDYRELHIYGEHSVLLSIQEEFGGTLNTHLIIGCRIK